jgi:glycosyltransferase involved in cell wall biosynthesis
MKKNIAIDISSLHLTGTGTATYIIELMRAIEALESDVTFSRFDCPPMFSRSSRVLRKIDTIYRELLWQHAILPSQVRKSRADILHSPAMISPVKCSTPVVLTIFDTCIISSPQSFPLWQRTITNQLLPTCLNRADKLIAISHFTKSEILRLYPYIPADKIEVTWLGVNPRFKIIDDIATGSVRSKYTLQRPFILSVSTSNPRKNLKTLIHAYAGIKDRIYHDLVLTGEYGWKSTELYSLVTDLGLSERVKFTGYVPLEELPAIYNLADLFVYPSLYEGFGLPPLEAMACGTPVITSNVTSLPEVVGDAAITLDPLDTELLAQKMVDLITHDTERKALRGKGLERAKLFTWDKCARETLAVYDQLISASALSS